MIIVAGLGKMGRVIASALSEKHDVVGVDVNQEFLNEADVSKRFNGNLLEYPGLKEAELVVTALPSEVAPPIVRKLLDRGKRVVDISFTDYDPFSLDPVAKGSGAVYVPHAGFAPGLSNILAGYLYYMEGSRNMEIIVGGLQEKPQLPMFYNPTFNPSSVIDEYIRPARYLESGKIRSIEPLDKVERCSIDGVGECETFVSDGLSTILHTFKDASIVEKTLRYPGHLEKMKFLRDMGYFDGNPDEKGSPRSVSNSIFGRLQGSFPDLSYLNVYSKDSRKTSLSCIDHFDTAKNMSSMSRMTGYSAAAISEIMISDFNDISGVFPVEWLGREKNYFEKINNMLKKRGIEIKVVSRNHR